MAEGDIKRERRGGGSYGGLIATSVSPLSMP